MYQVSAGLVHDSHYAYYKVGALDGLKIDTTVVQNSTVLIEVERKYHIRQWRLCRCSVSLEDRATTASQSFQITGFNC